MSPAERETALALLHESQKRILKALFLAGGTGHAGEIAGTSRHRLRDLWTAGLVEQIGTQSSLVGKPITVWALTEAGNEIAGDIP